MVSENQLKRLDKVTLPKESKEALFEVFVTSQVLAYVLIAVSMLISVIAFILVLLQRMSINQLKSQMSKNEEDTINQ